MKKIEELSLYLYHVKNIKSNLKIQKILFLLRVYEKLNNISSIFFSNDSNNFKAWIYGPVNLDSYHYIARIIDGSEQLSDEALLSMNHQDFKKYDSVIDKFIDLYPSELVDITHNNLAYINARNGLEKTQPCNVDIDESGEDFVTFKQWKFPK